MVVDGLIVLTVIKVTALSVLAVPMVMELRKVIRGLEMTGDVVEPRTSPRTARRRRMDRVSTALSRLTLVKNVWDGIGVLLVLDILFSMTNRVISVRARVKSFITPRNSVVFQRADTRHRAP